ncbi:3-phosphoshikimate 1-carboxyvinyltransferase [Alteromonas sp. 5E99-2]|uniref:3-phosphoshikimate 1-carboxyvinyltransferase n=1 Tax=Alteromonas sp. 5E99-2 TaxID=2817683 RepID=UPI001A9A1134|nr:3-phosphoshikimate 1-carboxyvinyltransferase [Alteromonas sp. 5E99-2]MBO1254233.1 3-phosphoshikimate 1-carboxyvinyltransferase [Alteromonas sp. 5E99-2]
MEETPSVKVASSRSQSFLNRIPKEILATFTEEQLSHLHSALGAGSWKKHNVDIRTTFPIPFVKSRLYLVLLIGRNRRDLSRKEKQISAFTITLVITGFVLASSLFGLLVLYLIKSALGINLFQNFSLGIWDWFKGL